MKNDEVLKIAESIDECKGLFDSDEIVMSSLQ